jgi:hypothetical protein
MFEIESTSFINTQEALAQMWLAFGPVYAKMGLFSVLDVFLLIGFVAVKIEKLASETRSVIKVLHKSQRESC